MYAVEATKLGTHVDFRVVVLFTVKYKLAVKIKLNVNHCALFGTWHTTNLV